MGTRYCDHCQQTTEHESCTVRVLPRYAPKYTYPFEEHDGVKCAECGEKTPEEELQTQNRRTEPRTANPDDITKV